MNEKFITLDLGNAYSIELKLGKRKVIFYKEKGIDFLLDSIKRNGSCEGIITENGRVYELPDGCHRAKALYELGCRQIQIEFDGIAHRNQPFGVLLGEVSMLEEDEYKEWFEKTFERSLPEWSE